jgi:hypothetical protein
MLRLDLRSNWKLVKKQEIRSKPKVIMGRNTNQFEALPWLTFPVDSRILIVGLSSEDAKPNWYLGAWLGMRLPLSPSQSRFGQDTQAAEAKAAIGRLNLVQFPDLGIPAYTLSVQFPKWYRHIYIEIWKYTGHVNVDSTETLLNELKTKVDLIATKVS